MKILSTRITFFLAFALLFGLTLNAQQTVKSSEIVFHIKNAGITVDGTLGNLKADITFDPNKLAQSQIIASVDISTIDTGIKMRDDHLKKKKYFDVAQYPSITMKSLSFKKNAGNQYTGTFALSIKENTKEIELPFTYKKSGNGYELAGSFTIDRREYSVGSGSLILGDDVEVDLKVSVE